MCIETKNARRGQPYQFGLRLLEAGAGSAHRFSNTDHAGLVFHRAFSPTAPIHQVVARTYFERTPFGVAPTKRGEIVIAQARKALEANDHILSLGGATKETRTVRIGVSATYAETFVRALELVPEVRDHSSIYCDRSDELAKLLSENYVDVAFLQRPHEPRERVVAQRMQNYVRVAVARLRYVARRAAADRGPYRGHFERCGDRRP